jgi:hypothetical protein
MLCPSAPVLEPVGDDLRMLDKASQIVDDAPAAMI